MSQAKKARSGSAAVSRIAFVGVMAALIFAASKLAFPLLGSKVHLGNTLCILSGLLFGPVSGGLAAGLGSALTDILGGYNVEDILITFASKFAMAAVAGLLLLPARGKSNSRRAVWCAIASVVGAWFYVFLYMLKHFVKQALIYQVGHEATLGVLAGKFPASAINAVFAMICAPLLYHALYPALSHMSAYRKIGIS